MSGACTVSETAQVSQVSPSDWHKCRDVRQWSVRDWTIWTWSVCDWSSAWSVSDQRSI